MKSLNTYINEKLKLADVKQNKYNIEELDTKIVDFDDALKKLDNYFNIKHNKKVKNKYIPIKIF